MTFHANSDDQTYQFHGKGSDTLFVWFGGINEPFFSADFPRLSGFDCLYFVDKKYTWYTGGLLDSLPGEAIFAGALTEFIKGYKMVCFAGQSSGGYAALYYGKKCNADLVIAFSPQTKNFFNGQCVMVPHVKLQNIAKLYADGKKNPLVVLNIGRSEKDHADSFEWHDHLQVAELKELNGVTHITHPYDNHAVSVIMRKDGILYSFLLSLVTVYGKLKR